MEKKKGFGITINMGVSSAFVLLIILTTLSLCAFIYFMLRSFLREDLQKQIYNIVSVGALTIDGEIHNSLVSRDQESSAEYIAIKTYLQDIKKNAIDIRFVYTMRVTPEGRLVFVVDAETSDEMSHIGDVYESPTDTMMSIAADKSKPMIESGFSTDKWGTWLSGFAPIRTKSGEFAGILGIDMSAKKIVEHELTSFFILASVAALVCLLVVLFGIIISRRITKPLKLLEADMAKITKFRIDEDVNVRSMFHEIKSMNLAINNMKGSLRSFKKYVPADLVAELITLNKEARLGGERKELTIFFSDIEGSTTMGEKLDPESLVRTMAGYFSGMTERVLANRGTVDKFIGDCVMAFWNAPTDNDDHAYCGCVTALECQAFNRAFNEELAGLGIPAINTRIGVNTGEVIVGNIGYEARLNYTVLGDHANLASRLEGINKLYRTKIVISENTYERVRGRVVVRILDSVVVKGKTEDILIYELLALEENATEQHHSLSELAGKAFDCYRSRKWDEAMGLYGKVLAMIPQDHPSELIMERAKKFKLEPPPADWHGAYILRDK